MRSVEPERALDALAEQLRAEESVISPHVRDPEAHAVLGLLVAAGPRAAGEPGEYALVIEAVREGYLLHYGEPRLLVGADDDLALLAGDYLYAIGLERLASLGDLEAVRELSDLISLSAEVHGGGGDPSGAMELWLASAVALATAPSPVHEAAKGALREGHPGAAAKLWQAAVGGATEAGLTEPLGRAAEAVGFGASDSL
jgi:hypothetical protein